MSKRRVEPAAITCTCAQSSGSDPSVSRARTEPAAAVCCTRGEFHTRTHARTSADVSSKGCRPGGCTKRVICGGYEPPAARRHILGRKISHVATFAFAGGSGQRAAAWRRRHATIVAAMASGTSCGASRPRDSESSSSVICIERFDQFYLFMPLTSVIAGQGRAWWYRFALPRLS